MYRQWQHNGNGTNLHRIIDTEFEEIVNLSPVDFWLDVVIEVYERYDRNVPANIALAIREWGKTFGKDFSYALEATKRHSKRFAQYEQEVQKYMILI